MSLRWGKRVRVLAADDSQVMRSMFHALFGARFEHGLEGLPEMELCGVARDGVECLSAVSELQPDVLLLDLEMPRMGGLEVLERLRAVAPGMPAIMCSTRTERGARATLDGLARGAADYVTKPTASAGAPEALRALAEDLLPKIAALAGWSFMGSGTGSGTAYTVAERGSTGRMEVVAIGVSTGGPAALEQMLPMLPKSFPAPVVIVQHMPKLFTSALAERLDRCCALRVREGFEGAAVKAGTIWIAPGDAHLEVVAARDGSGSELHLRAGERGDQYKPSVDVLFGSVAERFGSGALAVVMTGMGSDGLEGSRRVVEEGGSVLVQDEVTSAVWGMPARVADAGIASAVLPLGSIAGELVGRAGRAGRFRSVRAGRALQQMEGCDGMF